MSSHARSRSHDNRQKSTPGLLSSGNDSLLSLGNDSLLSTGNSTPTIWGVIDSITTFASSLLSYGSSNWCGDWDDGPEFEEEDDWESYGAQSYSDALDFEPDWDLNEDSWLSEDTDAYGEDHERDEKEDDERDEEKKKKKKDEHDEKERKKAKHAEKALALVRNPGDDEEKATEKAKEAAEELEEIAEEEGDDKWFDLLPWWSY